MEIFPCLWIPNIWSVALFLCLNKNLLLTIGFKPHLSRIPNLCNSGLYIIKIIVWLHRVFNGCCFFLNCYITHILFSHGNWSVSIYLFFLNRTNRLLLLICFIIFYVIVNLCNILEHDLCLMWIRLISPFTEQPWNLDTTCFTPILILWFCLISWNDKDTFLEHCMCLVIFERWR